MSDQKDTGKLITLRRLFDGHCHFRLSPLLDLVLPQTARCAEFGVAMPNTRPRAILTGDDVTWYRNLIMRALDKMENPTSFEPVMTIEVRDNTTPAMIIAAAAAGAKAAKAYVLGTTTNSDQGLRDFFSRGITNTFSAMQDYGMRLLIHGELNQSRLLVTKREQAFLPTLSQLAEKFPNLKIVLEHVSTKAAVELVKSLGPNVAATITAHHLCLTLNDVIGDGLRPHNACMPMPKDFDDRDALIEAATSGNPKFFLGSDSAPHLRENKECAHGACGCYTAPILPEVLTEIFEVAGRLENLENYWANFGLAFYDLPARMTKITMVKKIRRVPEIIDGVVPFRAGQYTFWQLFEE
ncbi:MAG: dihydroorotase [Candidatus Buchananbacteria bacterium]